MAPSPRQLAGNSIATGAGRTVSVTFDQPTLPGSLVVVVASGTRDYWTSYGFTLNASGFTQAFTRVEDELMMTVWYQAAAPAMSTLSVSINSGRAFQVRAHEVTGMAQTAVLDQLVHNGDNDDYKRGSSTPRSGSTGTLAQSDEYVMAFIANRYVSEQSGFTGGLTRLSDTITPDRWSEDDYKRSRLTVHQAITSATSAWSIGAQLATMRDWIAAVLTFKGGASGPARMVSTDQPAVLTTTGGSGDLTVFGPLVSTNQPEVLSAADGSGQFGPFELQWRLGGWDGLLIGQDTDYRIEKIDGLGGWDMRISDGDFPRGDGSSRGVDYQSAREIVFSVNFDHPSRSVMETRTQALLAALRPQPDEDWELLFRLPGMPLQMLRCRPTALARELDIVQMLLRSQTFALRAADPRIYSASERIISVPVTPAGQDDVDTASVANVGNAPAYPVVRIDNRGSTEVTAVQVVNATAGSAFEISGVIPPGAQLVGDMPARVTAAPRSVVTLDGQPKYGAWQPPRDPFYLAPDPYAAAGVNAVWCRTTPAGANVNVSLEYRDTWSG
ncbi:hypothetical protein [Pseudonocardia sp.]|uniref:hypothetical protein n=1 Tax=Pseudonocardia sp. TaxID=60912 RepID=UPI003D1324B6